MSQQQESIRSINALREILFLVNDLDEIDRKTLINILKKSDDFKNLIN